MQRFSHSDPLQYLTFPRWPQDGDEWLHESDVEKAKRLIPSQRVFTSRRVTGEFRTLNYGRVRVRAKPALCNKVSGDGIKVGDWVEICSRLGKNRAMIGQVAEMIWKPVRRSVCYRIKSRGMTMEKLFTIDDLTPLPKRYFHADTIG